MRFVVYQAPDGWRWRLVAGNGEVVASGEAYTRKADAVRACRAFKVGAYRAPIAGED